MGDIFSGNSPVRPTAKLLSGDALSKFDQLVPDARVYRAWAELRREQDFPESVQFATYVQPPSEGETPLGIWVKQGELAVFNVVSPNPHPRYSGSGHLIKTFAHTPLVDFREAEDDYWRFAGAPDPILAIFRALLTQHMGIRKNWEELD